MSIDTQGLPPYDEQRTGKLKKKPIYIAPVSVIKQMKDKENKNLSNLKSKKK